MSKADSGFRLSTKFISSAKRYEFRKTSFLVMSSTLFWHPPEVVINRDKSQACTPGSFGGVNTDRPKSLCFIVWTRVELSG